MLSVARITGHTAKPESTAHISALYQKRSYRREGMLNQGHREYAKDVWLKILKKAEDIVKNALQ